MTLNNEPKPYNEWTKEELFAKFAKLVWCRDYRCSWNIAVDDGVQLKQTKDYQPLGDDTMFRGICGRAELGLVPETVTNSYSKRDVATCRFRSSRSLGHLDFTKLLPQVVDRNPPPPADSTFHSG